MPNLFISKFLLVNSKIWVCYITTNAHCLATINYRSFIHKQKRFFDHFLKNTVYFHYIFITFYKIMLKLCFITKNNIVTQKVWS